MGNKIITEKDFWKCDGGLIPTQFQSTQQVAKTKSGERYITQSDTATVSFADFSCTKLMLIMAILTALIAVAVVATGGAALIAIGAVAGAAGAVAGAVVGSLLCGQMVAKVRKWIGGKQNFKIQGIPTITGNHTMLCPLFGSVISIDTQTKTWGQALAQGGAKFIEGVMQGMLLGALTGIGGAVFGGVRTALTSNQTIGQLGLQFIKTAPQNVINNFGQGFTNGTAFKLLDGLTNWLKTYGDKGEATLEDFKEGVSESTFGDVNAVKSVLTTGGTYQDWIAVAMLFTPAGGKAKNTLQNNITDTPNSKKTDTDTSNNKKTDENSSVKKNNINFEAESQNKNGEAYAEGGDAPIQSEKIKDIENDTSEIIDIIALRKQQSTEFYKKHNPDMKMRDIESHIAGIDFTQSVEIVKIPAGKELIQYTKINTKGDVVRGEYYTDNSNNTPSDLGISDTYNVRDPDNGWRQTQEVREVVKEKVIIPKDVEGLKSTSAEINDTWSRIDEYGNQLPTHRKGGGSQIYIPKSQF